MARDVLKIRRQLLQPNDPLIAASLADIAWAAGKQDKTQEVEALQREAFKLQRQLLGEFHPKYMESLRNLCHTLEAAHQYTEAAELHHASFTAWVRREGSDSPVALIELEALARDLQAEKRPDELGRILDEALTPAFVDGPASAPYLRLRVDLRCRRRQWSEAAADVGRLLQREPEKLYHYHQLAGLLAISGNRPAYQQLCQTVISRFGHTTDRHEAEQVAQECLLLPDCGVDLTRIDAVADAAVTLKSGQTEYAYSEACKALSCYRLGRYAEAIEWANKALTGPYPHAQAKACAVLALAHWHLEHKEEAREMLARGERLAPANATGSDLDEDHGSWMGWVFARVTLDEAAALVRPVSAGEIRP